MMNSGLGVRRVDWLYPPGEITPGGVYFGQGWTELDDGGYAAQSRPWGPDRVVRTCRIRADDEMKPGVVDVWIVDAASNAVIDVFEWHVSGMSGHAPVEVRMVNGHKFWCQYMPSDDDPGEAMYGAVQYVETGADGDQRQVLSLRHW